MLFGHYILVCSSWNLYYKVSALVDEVNHGSEYPSGTGSVDHGGGEHFGFQDMFQFGWPDS
jgi:hypothetical protein